MRRRVQNSADKQEVKPSDERPGGSGGVGRVICMTLTLLGFCVFSIARFAWHKERWKQDVTHTSRRSVRVLAVSGSAASRCGQIEAQSFRRPSQKCANKSSVVLPHREMNQSNRISICLKQISVHGKRQR